MKSSVCYNFACCTENWNKSQRHLRSDLQFDHEHKMAAPIVSFKIKMPGWAINQEESKLSIIWLKACGFGSGGGFMESIKLFKLMFKWYIFHCEAEMLQY